MPTPWTGKYVASVILLLSVFEFNRVLSLSCLKAEYQIGEECCPKCPAGNRVNKHCTEYRSTSCLPCDDGTYMDQLSGQTTCLLCTQCDAGSGLKVKRACTSLLDALCEPQEGFFCIDPKDDSCVRAHKHKKCLEGQYIKKKGTSSTDTVCSDCEDGTFSNGTFTECRPHTQCESLNQRLRKPGSTSADAECEEEGKSLLIGIIVSLILLMILAGALTAFCIIYRKKNKGGTFNIVRRIRQPAVSKKKPGEENISLKHKDNPNIEADPEVPNHHETIDVAPVGS